MLDWSRCSARSALRIRQTNWSQAGHTVASLVILVTVGNAEADVSD